ALGDSQGSLDADDTPLAGKNPALKAKDLTGHGQPSHPSNLANLPLLPPPPPVQKRSSERSEMHDMPELPELPALPEENGEEVVRRKDRKRAT
ncbi:unnamed protein product, partial [Polarella glacialis]